VSRLPIGIVDPEDGRMPLIELDHVSMTFRVREQFQITLKEYLLKGMFFRSVNPLMKIRALRDVSLRLGNGDRVGILGGNGAGKSTLLRLLAGIYSPTHGRRVVKGRISSLFELSLGFEMEATGRQNIFYRGYLQGESPRGVRAKLPEIADFCELGRYLDIPVRFYSAGMLVRLAFAIATTIQPEILLVDEVLSAGDLAFHSKARERMRDMISRAKIMVIVSHDLNSLAAMCDKGVWLHKGRVRMTGSMDAVIAAYKEYSAGDPSPPGGALSDPDLELPDVTDAGEPLAVLAEQDSACFSAAE
jgi:ABC-type polysaccharide/polyol phosphate transport system ATPase subunit